MQNFKQRMFQLRYVVYLFELFICLFVVCSQTAGTIDASLIRTPITKVCDMLSPFLVCRAGPCSIQPMELSAVDVSTPLPPPPSILKVKQPPPPRDDVRGESSEEGEEVEEGEGKSTPATATRKIRYIPAADIH